jgi:hypothetical protein
MSCLRGGVFVPTLTNGMIDEFMPASGKKEETGEMTIQIERPEDMHGEE